MEIDPPVATLLYPDHWSAYALSLFAGPFRYSFLHLEIFLLAILMSLLSKRNSLRMAKRGAFDSIDGNNIILA